MIHPNRSKEAFLQLIDDWKGIGSPQITSYTPWTFTKTPPLYEKWGSK